MASDNMPAPHVILLGEALRPALRKVRAQLDAAANPAGPRENFPDFGQRVLAEVADSVDRLANEVKALNGVVRAADVPAAKVHRVVGRLEMVFEELLGSHAEVRDARAASAHERGRRLLLTALRRVLTQIRDWLRDVVDAAADPLAVVKRKGLSTSGQVTLNLTLDLDSASDMDEFHDWVLEQSEAERRGNGCGGGLLAFVAGVFLGGLFFGDDE